MPQHDAEDRRGDGNPFASMKYASRPKATITPTSKTELLIAKAHDAEQQDHRHGTLRGTRRRFPAALMSAHPTKQQQVREKEDQQHGVDGRRVLDEDGRSGFIPFR
jgi:hypothetical protein